SMTKYVGASSGEDGTCDSSEARALATITVLPAPEPASTVTCEARSSEASGQRTDSARSLNPIVTPPAVRGGDGVNGALASPSRVASTVMVDPVLERAALGDGRRAGAAKRCHADADDDQDDRRDPPIRDEGGDEDRADLAHERRDDTEDDRDDREAGAEMAL